MKNYSFSELSKFKNDYHFTLFLQIIKIYIFKTSDLFKICRHIMFQTCSDYAFLYLMSSSKVVYQIHNQSFIKMLPISLTIFQYKDENTYIIKTMTSLRLEHHYIWILASAMFLPCFFPFLHPINYFNYCFLMWSRQ